ncbi:MAG TPA: hypothetical protein VHC42_02825 [Rhizomicrobium sp.]|nr:hypothetical protein [Rhizomicrobium sp.]
MWNSLRRARKGADKGSQTAAAPMRSRDPRREQFQQREFAQFAKTVRAAGIELPPVDEFCRRYAAYYESADAKAQKPNAGFGLFKFDIHADIARPVEMARILKDAGGHGLFLVMHSHGLNEAWHGSRQMWDALGEIRSLGHEIGLHADPFHLIATRGDLYAGLDEALSQLRGAGVPIRALTLHGDSRASIKARRLQANDFFADGFRRSKWDGLAPEGLEMLADHVGKYHHLTLFRRLGVEYVADVHFVRRGELLNRAPMMYLSDNQRRLRIGNIAPDVVAEGLVEAPDTFSIPDDFGERAAGVLIRRPFLALFHPQWYA